MGEASNRKRNQDHRVEVLHRRKLFGGRETVLEVWQSALPRDARCMNCTPPGRRGPTPVEFAIMWLSLDEVSSLIPHVIAMTPPEVLAEKTVKFQWPWQDAPSQWIGWATFYLCQGCVKDGETKLAGMMRSKMPELGDRKPDELGFLEWKRPPGKEKAFSSVPDELVGSGISGPGGGTVERSYKPLQRSAIIDPGTGKNIIIDSN